MFLLFYEYFFHDWNKRKNINSREEALKLLKRDIDFVYDKNAKTYIYKGKEISAEKAINYVVNNSFSELKKYLMTKEGD